MAVAKISEKEVEALLVSGTLSVTGRHAWKKGDNKRWPKIVMLVQVEARSPSLKLYAIDGAFGGGVNYGTIIKDYTESEQPGRYGPPIMTGAARQVIRGAFDKEEICTSHVERHNLSIRTFLRRFTRLATRVSKKLENLTACVCLYIAHYNYCRVHGSLPGTPAMAAKIAGHPWTMEELYDSE